MQKSSTLTALRKYNQAISILNYQDWSWYVMEEVSDPDFRAHMCSYGFSLPSLSTQILIGPSFMQTRETHSVHTVLINFMEVYSWISNSLSAVLCHEKKKRILLLHTDVWPSIWRTTESHRNSFLPLAISYNSLYLNTVYSVLRHLNPSVFRRSLYLSPYKHLFIHMYSLVRAVRKRLSVPDLLIGIQGIMQD